MTLSSRCFVIEQRYAAGVVDRLGPLAAELVRMNVDVKAPGVNLPIINSLMRTVIRRASQRA